MLAPKAVGSASEAWVAPEHAHARASAHPNRAEAIPVSVQSKDGSWCLVATFDRDERWRATLTVGSGAVLESRVRGPLRKPMCVSAAMWP
eukprot:6530929-Prymnesium_polylepis.1